MLKIIGKFYRFLWIGDDLDAIFDVMKLEISYNVYSNIYIHSLDGFDRVSCVMGAYQMKFLNKSLKDVMTSIMEFYRQQGNNHGISFRFYNQLQWYCLSLNRTKEECVLGSNGNDSKSY